MKQLKHTPGPWIVIETPIINQVTYSVATQVPTSRNSIATHILAHIDNSISQAEANTRLISCCPEMLEALIELYKACDNEWGSNFREESKIKDLIERATGMKIDEEE